MTIEDHFQPHRKLNLSEDNKQSLTDGDKKHFDDRQQEDPKSHDKENIKLSEDQQPDSSSDDDDNVVPVVVTPGHIRFDPLEEVPSGCCSTWPEKSNSSGICCTHKCVFLARLCECT